MHYTPLLRNMALQHAATACVTDLCLLCELGFVFDMLQKAEGSTCQATNMFKALGATPQGSYFQRFEVRPRLLTLRSCASGTARGGDPRAITINNVSGAEQIPV